MKQKFSTAWKASKRPSKQRKYRANAPQHIRRKMLSVTLSKDLRKKYLIRNIPVRKGDNVKIVKGKFKNKEGKIIEIKLKKLQIFIEGVQIKKTDGSKVNFPLRPANLKIINLNLEDKKRIKNKEKEIKEQTKKINGEEK